MFGPNGSWTWKPRTFLGLDMTSTSVRLLELSRRHTHYQVEAYGIEPLPEGDVTEHDLAQVEAIGYAIQRLVKRAGARSEQAAVAVAGSAAVIREVSLPPGLDNEDLEAHVQVAAEEKFPFSLEEAALDFTSLAPPEKSGEQVDILMVACLQKQISLQKEALAVGGLQVRFVDIEPCCVQRAWHLISGRKDQVVAVVDVGATLTRLSVLTNAVIPYARELPFGERQLIEEVQHQYDLSAEEATLALKQNRLPKGYRAKVLQPFGESLVQQVRHFLQLFYLSAEYDDLDQLLMAGSFAGLGSLSALVAQELGTPCSIVNPFTAMSKAPDINRVELEKDAPALMTACGLALRGFL